MNWLLPSTDLGWFVFGMLAPGLAKDCLSALRWLYRRVIQHRTPWADMEEGSDE